MSITRTGRPKGAKGKCDRLFSQIVRARGFCEACGERNYSKLQCAHIVSRRYSSTRCDPENALCLCASCHRRFTDNPFDFYERVCGLIGLSKLNAIRARAQPTTRMDWDAKLGELREMASGLGVG